MNRRLVRLSEPRDRVVVSRRRYDPETRQRIADRVRDLDQTRMRLFKFLDGGGKGGQQQFEQARVSAGCGSLRAPRVQ